MKMTEKEAGKLVLIIQDFVPSYRPTDTTAANWRRILGKKMTFTEAEKYLYQHFETSRFLPMPADLIALWQADFNPDDIIPLEPPADMRGESHE
ncbi:hypothetical protein D3C81_837520 [compost metagenome]